MSDRTSEETTRGEGSLRLFATRLVAAREAKGLTPKQFAQKASVSFCLYEKFEEGKRRPELATLVRLSCALDVTADYLLGEKPKYPVIRLTPDLLSEIEGHKNMDAASLQEKVRKSMIKKLQLRFDNSVKFKEEECPWLRSFIHKTISEHYQHSIVVDENSKALAE